MDQDLEGELGIDTVKQAEIMGDVREIFSLPVDEDFVLSDHPTLNHFVSYIVKMKGGGTEAAPAPAPVAAPAPAAPLQLPNLLHRQHPLLRQLVGGKWKWSHALLWQKAYRLAELS